VFAVNLPIHSRTRIITKQDVDHHATLKKIELLENRKYHEETYCTCYWPRHHSPTAAKWEKGAHDAFDRDIVPVFNQWVGLPGFAAVVDAKSKRVIGCVNSSFDANEMAREIRQMASKAQGSAYMSNASVSSKTTRCPAAHNVDPGL